MVGAGGAGLAAACRARALGLDVLVLSKEPAGVGDTRISTGIVAVPEGPDRETFVQDVLRSGLGQADPALVEALAEDAVVAHRWLQQAGVRPAREASGALVTLPEPMGGHQKARSVPHRNRGLALATAAARLSASRGVPVQEDTWVMAVLQDEEGVTGVLAWDARRGEPRIVEAPHVLLATGGATQLFFPHCDTLRSNTGDGLALALRAGARTVDMEMVQFTPFGLCAPREAVGLPLGEPTLAGPRGLLRDAAGAVILRDVAQRTRSEVAGVIAATVAAGRGTPSGGVQLDLSANLDVPGWADAFRSHWGHVLRRIRRHQGREAARFERPWHVAPTAHYQMGGVRVDVQGRTGVPGLWCAGQVVGGVHGANRLGSTSLPGVVAMGLRGAEGVAGESRRGGRADGTDALAALQRPAGRGGAHPLQLTRQLQRMAWKFLGPARTQAGLEAMRAALPGLRAAAAGSSSPMVGGWCPRFLAHLELKSLLVVAEAMVEAALVRGETLGAHVLVAGTPRVLPSPLGAEGTLDFTVQRSGGAPPAEVSVSLSPGVPRPTVLDALLQVQAQQLPDLGLRWGCRTGRCGTCTVRVDGQVRLACRDRLSPGATVAPAPGLPVLKDLIVDRSGPDHLLDGRCPQVVLKGGESGVSPPPEFLSLERCITCYACLDGCPAHAEGAGNPAAFLRLQQVRVDAEATPGDRDAAHRVALELGLTQHCASCRGCRCGIGIRLVPEVIDPLLGNGP